jgi:lysine 2,3-aminomutase
MSSKISNENWAKELSKGLISVEQLIQHQLIHHETSSELDKIKENFDIRVPSSFLAEIKNKNDALAKQFIPSKNELVFLPEELEDPIGDEVCSPVEGITHRYPDRVLLKPTYMCAAYCRFCFRRYKVSQTQYNLSEQTLHSAINYILNHECIEEVILTGGDPLTLTDKNLKKILDPLSKIQHLKIIRIHTRVPSLLPSRIQVSLVELLKQTQKSIWVAAHINHASEFSTETKRAIACLVDGGIPVLLQSVLLKGVNDSNHALVQLLKTAVENRVKPYYLHYPDLAKGTSHFRVPLNDAINLVKNLRGKISGLCIPQFIIDIPNGRGKIAINPHHAKEISDGLWEFESPLDGQVTQVKYT